jgi:hypothetical protein
MGIVLIKSILNRLLVRRKLCTIILKKKCTQKNAICGGIRATAGSNLNRLNFNYFNNARNILSGTRLHSENLDNGSSHGFISKRTKILHEMLDTVKFLETVFQLCVPLLGSSASTPPSKYLSRTQDSPLSAYDLST